MVQLQYKTLEGDSPQGKSRVYFTCHPQDFLRCFQKITDELLQCNNCAVYYYEEEPELDEEYYVNLQGMQLMVIPVTKQLLCQSNRAVDVELAYALEHHIPVLPLMQERGMEEKYAEVFGNLQFLDRGNWDATAIPYEEKLEKYLNSVLLDDETTAKIQAAFDAWIFLSYRKKDRKLAQELMKLIHSDPNCRDIAIWYDEFLNPGEDFSDAIRKALEESQLFVLAVTPNLLEKDNYVMKEEYPAARKAKKPIVPAEMEKTDRDALKLDFSDLPEPLDIRTDGAVGGAVLDALGELALRKNDENPRHVFFIGLAYLSGLFVEKDHDRAVRLITQAAESGLTEAMEKMASMYEMGEGVQKDRLIAISWREKIAEQARLTYVRFESEDAAGRYFRCLLKLGRAWSLYQNPRSARSVYETMLKVAKERVLREDTPTNLSWLSISYGQIGDVCRVEGKYAEAKDWFYQDLAIGEKLKNLEKPYLLHNLSITYKRLGDVCWEQKEHADAKQWWFKNLTICFHLAQTGEDKYLEALADSFLRLEKLSKHGLYLADVKDWYLQDVKLKKILAEQGTQKSQRDLSNSYIRLGEFCDVTGKPLEAKQFYVQSVTLLKKLAQYNQWDDLDQLKRLYCVLGNLCEKNQDLSGAGDWYQQELDQELYMTQTFRTPTGDNLARLYGKVGWAKRDISLLETSLKLYEELAKRSPQMEKADDVTFVSRAALSAQIGVLNSPDAKGASAEELKTRYLNAFGKAIGLDVKAAMGIPKPRNNRA